MDNLEQRNENSQIFVLLKSLTQNKVAYDVVMNKNGY